MCFSARFEFVESFAEDFELVEEVESSHSVFFGLLFPFLECDAVVGDVVVQVILYFVAKVKGFARGFVELAGD